MQALRVLERQRSILPAAAVNLKRLLVCKDIHLDAAPRARQCRHRAFFAPVVGSVGFSVDQEAIVVAAAICAAIADDCGGSEVGADLFWGGVEVIDGVWEVSGNIARRN